MILKHHSQSKKKRLRVILPQDNDAALLTDGAYTVGNSLVLNETSGTLTLGGNQTNGASLFTSDINLTRDVTLTSANTDANGVTFSGDITGPGSITKTGVGTL